VLEQELELGLVLESGQLLVLGLTLLFPLKLEYDCVVTGRSPF
jgi:hypothetical protein